MNFKQFLRNLRIEKNRNLKKDANDFGKTTAYLSIMENGKQPISDEYKEFLSKTYSVDIDVINSYLVTRTVVFYYTSDKTFDI